MIINHIENMALVKALKALKDEEVFIYPTDTIYGFGGDATSPKVLDRLYSIKQRPDNMPLSMIVRDKEMMSRYAHISAKAESLIDKFLPGPLTLVLPAKDYSLPDKLFNVEGYLGFRIPAHDFCRAMSSKFDRPIITSSVNISGEAPLNNINRIHDQFGNEIELMISDTKLDTLTEPFGSTVVMISEDESVKVLREAAISAQSIDRALI